MIIIASRRKHKETILREYPDAQIVDVTSKAPDEFVEFSPFFPHGHIPVPMMDEESECVEGIWQGLKVFEHEGIDVKTFRNNKMKGIKRTCKKHGKIEGHQYGDTVLPYIEARKKIYIPCYFQMLEQHCMPLLQRLKEMSEKGTLVLLDYDTNADEENPKKPLSHASLIKRYIETKMD